MLGPVFNPCAQSNRWSPLTSAHLHIGDMNRRKDDNMSRGYKELNTQFSLHLSCQLQEVRVELPPHSTKDLSP